MILSSADILRILGASEIIRLTAKLAIVDSKPVLSGQEGTYIYISRFPSVDEFEATWSIYIESDDDGDLVIAEIKRLLPSVKVTNGLMTVVTTTDFLSGNTQLAPVAPKERVVKVDLTQYEDRFQSLVEDVQDRMLLISSGKDGKDGKDGKRGRDGRDGKDIVATNAKLFDLKDVTNGIPLTKGQVLTWDGTEWTNLYVPQVYPLFGGGGGSGDGENVIVADNSPTTREDGTALVEGDQWWNSSTGVMYIWYVDGDSSQWVQSSGSTGGGGSGGGATVLNDLTDVFIDPAELANDQGLLYNGSEWVVGSPPVIIQVHNQTGVTITKGTPVYVSGTHSSGKPTVAPADSNGANTYPAIGLIDRDLPSGTDGYVLISGKLFQVDTDTPGWNAGDALYLSAVPGQLTNVRPLSVDQKVQKVALVTRRHPTVGTVLVIGAGRVNDIPNELTALTGVGYNATDLGTFTGDIVSDNTTIKIAIQELETAIGSQVIPEAPQDGNYYVRQDGQWVDLQTVLAILDNRDFDGGNFTTGTSDSIDGAPLDGGVFTP